MKGLTDKQAARLRYITSYMEEYGRSPSYNDIAEHFGISATAAHNTVRSLVKKGLLEKKEHNLRSLSLPRKERDRRLSGSAEPMEPFMACMPSGRRGEQENTVR